MLLPLIFHVLFQPLMKFSYCQFSTILYLFLKFPLISPFLFTLILRLLPPLFLFCPTTFPLPLVYPYPSHGDGYMVTLVDQACFTDDLIL